MTRQTTIAAAPSLVPHAEPSEATQIAEFMKATSFETTKPSDADLDGLKNAAPSGSRVYISAIPSRPVEQQIAAAVRLRTRGFEPVPHLAARNFATAAALDDYLARMVNEADVRCMLVIGGDRDVPAGALHRAIDAIDIGLIQSRGIRDIGIAGYPDGHPRIASVEMECALAAKIEAAEQTGLAVHIVTQFAFSAEPILAWIGRIRDLGIELPIKIGIAGPASVATLLRYAAICGVKTSVRALARNAGLAKHLFGTTAPDAIIRALASATSGGRLGAVSPHFFSFGGLGATARWAAAIAAGHITLDNSGGFTIEPR